MTPAYLHAHTDEGEVVTDTKVYRERQEKGPSVALCTSLPGLSTNHPPEGALGPQGQPQQWAVYVHVRGKKPRLADVQVPEKFPGEITVDDKTYVWVGADISQRTLTYSNFKPAVES